MSFCLIEDRRVLLATLNGDTISSHQFITELPEGYQTPPALFGKGEVYYCVDNTLRRSADDLCVVLPQTPTRIICFKNKVYVLCGLSIVNVDPLSKDAEVERLPHGGATDFAVFDKKFLLILTGGSAALLDLETNEVVAVEGAWKGGVRLLGKMGREIVVADDEGRHWKVNEGGKAVSCQPAFTSPWIQVDGVHLSLHVEHQEMMVKQKGVLLSILLSNIGLHATTLIDVAEMDAMEQCPICYCEFEKGDDSITLNCGHAFHASCIAQCLLRAEMYLEKGEHVVFAMAKCPAGCGTIVRHRIAGRASVIAERYRRIVADARNQSLFQSGKSMDDFLYYVCKTCHNPFYGGNKVCPRMIPQEPIKDPQSLQCESCNRDFSCPSHGRSFVLYKCRYCCNPATQLCFGAFRICDACDERWEKAEPPPVACVPEACPLFAHHPTSATSVIGCAACLSPLEFDWKKITPCKGKSNK